MENLITIELFGYETDAYLPLLDKLLDKLNKSGNQLSNAEIVFWQSRIDGLLSIAKEVNKTQSDLIKLISDNQAKAGNARLN